MPKIAIMFYMKLKTNISGWLYFYVHFVTEIACFYMLSLVVGDNVILWSIPLFYDAFAFVPQSIIGYISDRFPKIPFGAMGIMMMAIALTVFSLASNISIIVSFLILCFGNAFTHVAGAEVTLRSSNGKIAPVAIFVAGGSFGVITGKLLAAVAPFWFIVILLFSALPFIFLAEAYRKETLGSKNPCSKFNYANTKMAAAVIILAAILVVIVRSYMGYGIPTSWNKTTFQMVMLYVSMGVGKALGGILCDKIGVRKTAIISVLGALPFLLFGDNIMIVSLIGVMFFSMTMAITLALVVSVLQKTPGLAFGLTTIGLFLGSVPVFFYKLSGFFVNCIVIVVATIICYLVLMKVIKREQRYV